MDVILNIFWNLDETPLKIDGAAVVFLENINYFKFKNIDFKKTIAVNGEGILGSFEEILSLVFKNLYKGQIISALQ